MVEKNFRDIIYALLFIVGIVVLPLVILWIGLLWIPKFIIIMIKKYGHLYIIDIRRKSTSINKGIKVYLKTVKNKHNTANLIYLIFKKNNSPNEENHIFESIINILEYNLKHNFKKILFTTIISILFISYFQEICQIIDKYWVNNIINYLDNKISNSIFSALTIPVIIYYSRQFYLKKGFNGYKYLLILILICFHWFGIWDYSYKLILPIYCISIIEIIYSLFFLYSYGKISEENSIFVIDTPLKSNEENNKDSLGREYLVETSAKNLRTSFFKEGAFYVAVTGEWGSGKTSFTNLLTEKMLSDEKDIIKIEINTWRTEDPNLFTKYFFDTLNKELSVYIPELSRLLPKYLAIVANSCDNKYIKGASKILDSFSNNNNDPYESIKKVLIKSKKKIIVIIDDIDRLNAEEIYQILKLVRNTVDFPYMQFIMNFDKEYVVDCLGKFICDDTRNVIKIDNKKLEDRKSNSKNFNTDTQNKKAQNYLEKFIHMEIYLTPFESSTIPLCFYELLCDNGYKNIADELKGLIERNYFKANYIEDPYTHKKTKNEDNINKGIDVYDEIKEYRNTTLLGEVVYSIRNLKKLYNSFINTYLTIKQSNTLFQTKELFLIELLKFHDNQLYNQILENPNYIFIPKRDLNSKLYYNLNYNTSIYLNSISNQIICDLFSSKHPSKSSIQYLSNFDKYFYLRNSQSILTITNLTEIIYTEKPNIEKVINGWKNNMSEKGICHRIKEILIFFSVSEKRKEYSLLCDFIFRIIELGKINIDLLLPEFDESYFKYNFEIEYFLIKIKDLIDKDVEVIKTNHIKDFCFLINKLMSKNKDKYIYEKLSKFLIFIVNTDKLPLNNIFPLPYYIDIKYSFEFDIYINILEEIENSSNYVKLINYKYKLLREMLNFSCKGSLSIKNLENIFKQILRYINNKKLDVFDYCCEHIEDYCKKNPDKYKFYNKDTVIQEDPKEFILSMYIYIHLKENPEITILFYLFIEKYCDNKSNIREIFIKHIPKHVFNKFQDSNILMRIENKSYNKEIKILEKKYT